jgi:hypothetical protein
MNIVLIYFTLLAPFQYFLVKAKSRRMAARAKSVISRKALTSFSSPLNINGAREDKNEANATRMKCL